MRTITGMADRVSPDLDPARVLDAMSDGIVIVDRAGRISFANSAIARLSGFTIDELLGSPIEALVPQDRRKEHVGMRDRALEEGDLNRPMGTGRDIRLQRRDGTELPVDVSLSAMGEMVVAAVRDVRRSRAMATALAEERRRGAVMGERSRIARDLHDGIIQRLFAVGLSLRSADDRTLTGARDEAVRGIDGAIRDLRTYVSDLSDVRAPRSLAGAMAELIAELRSATSIDIDPLIDAATASRVSAHVPVLINFIREAVSNAIRHSDARTIEVNLLARGAKGRLEIVDDGSGFDPNTLPRRGGLDNLQARATALGGDLEIISSPGSGTRIVLSLPLREE